MAQTERVGLLMNSNALIIFGWPRKDSPSASEICASLPRPPKLSAKRVQMSTNKLRHLERNMVSKPSQKSIACLTKPETPWDSSLKTPCIPTTVLVAWCHPARRVPWSIFCKLWRASASKIAKANAFNRRWAIELYPCLNHLTIHRAPEDSSNIRTSTVSRQMNIGITPLVAEKVSSIQQSRPQPPVTFKGAL